nr:hypothetical protein [Tanacetum cinerariifolium]
YKATTDQLDWVNPKGQQYPYNLLQPVPLIPDNRGRRVILFEHFINNDLEYLRGVRRDDDQIYKFKEGDFKRLRLQDIKDVLLLLVQGKLSNLTVEERLAFNVSLRMFTRSIVIKRRVIYQNKDKKNRLIRIDELYKFSDGTLNDVHNAHDDRMNGIRMQYLPSTIWRKGDKDRAAAMIQAIKKMLKTRRIMRSLEKGFIYQNKDKKNRLMRIDELHKFSDGTLNDVRNALDDRLKGIRMQYLPSTIWRKGDKDRAAAMIQAIEKMLKTRRIMRSLEKFVGGRLYEGDLRMQQRTI